MAHVSDQGLFIVNYTNSSHLELIKANGDLSNNIALKAAISKGKGKGSAAAAMAPGGD